jgi:hypothetical protein
MTPRTPLRHSRAAALLGHLAARADCIAHYISALPEHQRDAAEHVAERSAMAGAFGALFILGGPAIETHAPQSAYIDWAETLTDLDALNVGAVIRHPRREGWHKRDVETALNDLANDEQIRLVAERDSGEVGIQLVSTDTHPDPAP